MPRVNQTLFFIIPNGIISLAKYAFEYSSFLENIIIPDGVKYIDECAFSDCTSLTSITIPESVKSMGDFVFSGCESLKTIYCKIKKPSIFGLPEGWSKDWKYDCKAKVIWGYNKK